MSVASFLVPFAVIGFGLLVAVGWTACGVEMRWASRLKRSGRSEAQRGRRSARGFRPPFLDGLPEAVAVGAGFDDVSAIRDPVQQRLAESSVGDHLGPLGKGQVRGQDGGGLLGPLGDNLEQGLGSQFGHRHVAIRSYCSHQTSTRRRCNCCLASTSSLTGAAAIVKRTPGASGGRRPRTGR